ncbi:Ger(x)C family spore germination protein [Paenibacillus chondroitinus]|uniref:Ger(X)C family spore germination protein n=1 Tax=Paenibacillus chondroitinus TaxID=59842 RepID=A0ABU6DF59_9BACL|nr:MULTISPECIES: Ger(x)C family spore germination protein [Paenibacillus]MCY9659281.1 Ger(x)C family spore germination protein [Paenibacillus anseongense]MEB4796384.1 Ger(x)C family spore germination protein [Paenibacillus chondroitinus]
MKKLCLILPLTVTLFISGCWDRNEINDYAFWIGTALDLSENGKLTKSAQVAVPADFKSSKGGGGSEKRANIVLTASGSTIGDLTQQIQDKLPRKVFLGHRRSIFIGEKLAKRGLVDIMDQFTRNTDTRMRTDIFVVNNGEGKDVLKINSPFNQFSAIVAVDQDRFCRLGDTALRDVLLDIGRDGIRPSMPMVEISPNNEQEKNEIIEVKSVAIFNKNLAMVGKVSGRESLELFWVKGVLKDQFLTEETEEGSISLYESNLKKSIRTEVNGNTIKAYVKLEGTGRVLENNTDVDISVSSERIPLESKLNEMKAKKVEATIKKMQQQHGQDVFGIGEEIHRDHPYQWKELRDKWDQLFPTVEVSVSVKLKIQNTGDIGKRIPGIGERT